MGQRGTSHGRGSAGLKSISDKDKELGWAGMGRAKQSRSDSRHPDISVPKSLQDS